MSTVVTRPGQPDRLPRFGNGRHDADRLHVQVEAGNAAALALWEGLGLTEHHRTTYAAPPG